MTTNEKENYSLQIIKINDLVRKFFKNAIKLEHIVDKERQLAGVDLIVYIKVGSAIEPVSIDAKCNYEENNFIYSDNRISIFCGLYATYTE